MILTALKVSGINWSDGTEIKVFVSHIPSPDFQSPPHTALYPPNTRNNTHLATETVLEHYQA